jgi:hypothetical protein
MDCAAPGAYGTRTVTPRGAATLSLHSIRPVVVLLAVAALVGCSSSVAAPLVPLVGPTPTPLATADQGTAATPKPAQKAKATPRPTKEPTSGSGYYKPPGWDGYSDVNCGAFDTHAHAQSFFKGTGGTTSNDPYALDRDHDGNACETLP